MLYIKLVENCSKKYLFDLVVESQEYARLNYGIHSNVKFEVLRLGK